jgi:hypothetical protein
MARIFISYARVDGAPLAERLERDLAASGHEPWRDRTEIEHGVDWSNAIEKAIDECDAAIALLTKGAYDSGICKAEQGRALRKQKRLLPLLVQKSAHAPAGVRELHRLHRE